MITTGCGSFCLQADLENVGLRLDGTVEVNGFD